jgi:hypothetical protein
VPYKETRRPQAAQQPSTPGPTPAASRHFLSSVPIITGPLSDGDRVGTFRALFITHNAAPNTPTTFNHKLGRIPNGWEQLLTMLGGVTWASAADVAAWTPLTIILRSTVASDPVRLLLK